jgi:hypothetical protein
MGTLLGFVAGIEVSRVPRGPTLRKYSATHRRFVTRRGLAGQVAERGQDVARLTLPYDILKAEALSPRASTDLARKAIERWT